MSTWFYGLMALTSLVATSLLIPPVQRFCQRRGWLDRPGGRKTHVQAVPRLGGVAIFLSFTMTVVVGYSLAPALTELAFVQTLLPQISGALAESAQVHRQLLGLLLGGTTMFAVGLLDDRLGERFPVHWKFAGQCLAAGIAVYCGMHVEFTGNAALNVAVSFLWILGISNAFNLLDNMDGLAAGVAVSSAFIFFLNAIALQEVFLCLVLATFIGSVLGFLRFNLHPAKIFMGDAGALFIGFVLSSLTILEHYVSPASSTLFPVLMPPLVLAVPLLDTLSVIFIRLRESRPIYRGDRCHLSHRLVRAGLTEPQAVVFLFLLTLTLGMGAMNLAHATPSHSAWTVMHASLVAGLVLGGIRVGSQWRRTRRDPSIPANRSGKAAEGL